MAVATGREFGLFIGGETVEGSSTRELVEPATGEPFGSAQLAGEADVDRAVDAARAALAGDWGKTSANERSRLLHALADAIVANRKELAELAVRGLRRLAVDEEQILALGYDRHRAGRYRLTFRTAPPVPGRRRRTAWQARSDRRGGGAHGAA